MELLAGLVRVLGLGGQTVGTGFLASDRIVLTCAHVVVNAGSGPGQPIDIAFHRTGQQITAHVDQVAWRDSSQQDLAILRLSSPRPAETEVLVLGTSLGTHSHAFETYGFARTGPFRELPAEGTIMRQIPNPSGWATLVIRSTDIAHGHSGAPIFDKVSGRVVGIINLLFRERDPSRMRNPERAERAGDSYGRRIDINFGLPSEEISNICPELVPKDICPYLGLRPFREKHHRFFFGRELAVDLLLRGLRQSPRFLLVVGTSGSGKSSVIEAGLFPQLRSGWGPFNSRVKIVSIRPGDDPYKAMREQGIPNGGSIRSGFQDMQADLVEGEHICFFVDQIEELLIPNITETRQQFLNQLLGAILDSSLRLSVILALRDDYYPQFTRLLKEREWGDLLMKAHMIVPAMDARDLRAAIEEPAKLVGLDFQAGLVSTIVEDTLKANYSLPLMESALERLWVERDEGLVTIDGYRKIGGVSGAVSTWAENAVYSLGPHAASTARRVLTRLIYYGPSERNDTRRPARISEMVNEFDEEVLVREIVNRLIDERLLKAYRDSDLDEGAVELIHDSLLDVWSTLKHWRREDREFLLWLQDLRADLNAWEQSGREGDYLLRDRPLRSAVIWRRGRSEDLNPLEREYIEQSFVADRRRQRRNMLVLSMIITLLLAAILMVIAFYGDVQEQSERRATAEAAATLEGVPRATALAEATSQVGQREIADQERRLALARVLANRAESTVNSSNDTELATLLTLEALRLNSMGGNVDSGYLKGVLLEVLTQPFYSTELVGHRGDITSLAFSPDGRLLAAAGEPHVVKVWNLSQTSLPPEALIVDTLYNANVVEFSPDGTWLAAGTNARTIVLWRVENLGVNPVTIIVGDDASFSRVEDITFSSDGRFIVAAGDEKIVRVWDLQNLSNPPLEFPGHQGIIDSVSISYDDQLLAATSPEGGLTMWNISDPGSEPIILHETGSYIEFSPSNSSFAFTANDGIHIRDIVDPYTDKSLIESSDRFNNLAWSPDGGFLVGSTIAPEQTFVLWDLADSSNPVTVQSMRRSVGALVFHPNGNMLATGLSRSGDSDLDATESIRLWNLSSSEAEPLALREHSGGITSLMFSSDQHHLASASADNTIRLWSIGGSAKVKDNIIFSSDSGQFQSVAFSPDGNMLAAVTESEIYVWNLLGSSQTDPFLVIPWEGLKTITLKSQDELAIGSGTFGNAGNITRLNVLDIDNINNILQEDIMSAGDVPNIGIGVVYFDPSGQYAAFTLEGSVSFIDLSSVNGRLSLPSPYSGPIHPHLGALAAVQNGGAQVIFAGQDNTISVWDVEANQVRQFLPDYETYTLAISYDGTTMAVGDFDGNIHLYSTEDLSIDPAVLRGHDSRVSAITFSPDGKTLVSGDGEGVIRFWVNDIDILTEIACRQVHRNLSVQEWQVFIGEEEPYHVTCPYLGSHPSSLEATNGSPNETSVEENTSATSAPSIISSDNVEQPSIADTLCSRSRVPPFLDFVIQDGAAPYAYPGDIVPLMLRNKWGLQGESYDLAVKVIAPGGSIYLSTTILEADQWTDIKFPRDFPAGDTNQLGSYSVVWETPDGQFVYCTGFTIKEPKAFESP